MLRTECFSSQTPEVAKLACLVAGFSGKIRHYRKPIAVLTAAGYDVVAFEYDNHILDTGEPARLRAVIDTITADITARAAGYETVICTGASLGAYIAVNVQRRVKKARLGLYGTAGVKVSHVIFHSRVFAKIKKYFVANGYDEAKLLAAWHDLDDVESPGLSADQSLVIILGRRDRIVDHREATALLDQWKQKGSDITYTSKRGLGHTGAIIWYRWHFDRLLRMHTLSHAAPRDEVQSTGP